MPEILEVPSLPRGWLSPGFPPILCFEGAQVTPEPQAAPLGWNKGIKSWSPDSLNGFWTSYLCSKTGCESDHHLQTQALGQQATCLLMLPFPKTLHASDPSRAGQREVNPRRCWSKALLNPCALFAGVLDWDPITGIKQ